MKWGYAFLLVLLAAVCSGQAVRATLVGRVTDPTGAVVPGTRITLVNVGTNEAHSMVVSDNGEFVFPQLAPGVYTLTSEHEGFRKDVRIDPRPVLLEFRPGLCQRLQRLLQFRSPTDVRSFLLAFHHDSLQFFDDADLVVRQFEEVLASDLKMIDLSMHRLFPE